MPPISGSISFTLASAAPGNPARALAEGLHMGSRSIGWFRGAQGLLSLSVACGAQVGCTPEGLPPKLGPTTSPTTTPPPKVPPVACARTITADVVAIDQPLMYNRMGAGQPNGMMFALKRDIAPTRPGTPPGPGNAMLRPDKRPRPLVLRADVGDCLTVHFTNWLASPQPQTPLPPPPIPTTPDGGLDMPGLGTGGTSGLAQIATLTAGITVMGLDLRSTILDGGTFVGANPNSLVPACTATATGAVPTGCSASYSFSTVEEGTYLLYSSGAAVNLPGAIVGGQLTSGLFGAVNVEPKGSSWYRSQVSRGDLAKASRPPKAGQKTGEFLPVIDYEATVDGKPDGVPVLNMLHRHKDASGQEVHEIVSSDLTAVITGPNHGNLYDPRDSKSGGPRYPDNPALPERWQPFREITTIYHDDLITTQAFAAFAEAQNGVDLTNVLGTASDLFAINYGIGGIAAEVYANRVKVGPAAECVECKFEEFFLSSWAGGDPATLVDVPAGIAYAAGGKQKATKAFYPDDPSNVYHSYLNDHVRFRLLHGGASIPHMHHLHAHQWLYAPNNDESSYLDSQAIGPGSAHTLDIAYGGTGNRNRTPGDSIFHCHFYPHFASGMWGLWRSHDVFEWGTDLDSDGRPKAGSRALPDGEIERGTPVPAIVPLPTLAMPPLPAPVSLKNNGKEVTVEQDPAKLAAAGASKNPGYPFYIPGIAGHRPPHPPLDFAVGKDGKPLDGGLPRHIVKGGTATSKETPTDFSKTLVTLDALELPEKGTPVERAAMEYHAESEHRTTRPDGTEAVFKTNGKKPAPGAPFADPCGDWAPSGAKEDALHVIVYQAAALQMDVTFNKKGWHFPQERITTLWQDVDNTLDGARPPEPFVFRANSRDCIEYQHTNVVPNVYTQDDFQIQTPTDILGQHIHLVKFDVTSSDGAENGWNYEDGTYSMDEVTERILAIDKSKNKGLLRCVEEKGGVCVKFEAVKLNPTTFQFPTDPRHPAKKPRKWTGAQTTIQRWWADPLLDNPKPGRPATDRTLRTVFTHDHFGPSTHQQAGLYAGLLVEPSGAVWFDPVTGERMFTRADGGPTSFQATIEPSGGAAFDAYREFALLSQNTQLSYKKGKKYEPGHPENALEPPADGTGKYTPDMITAGQMSGGAINYRNEPIPFRVNGTGKDADPHAKDLSYVFSSIKRGDPELDKQPAGSALSPGVEGTDPFTPVLRAYQGDNVQVRTLIGAQADHNVLTMSGVRWFFEPSNKLSGYRNSQTGGISEHFELLFTVPAASPGAKGDFADLLYSSNAVDSGLANGVWGLLRAYKGKQQDGLKALSNNPDLGKRLAPEGCPADAPVKAFEVVATSAKQALPDGKLVYYHRERNGTVDEIADQDGLLYVLKSDLQNGKLPADRRVEPLVLRARAGDCVKVTLENQLDPTLPVFDQKHTLAYAAFTPPTDWSNVPVFTSREVGLHPQVVSYDVATSDGMNVGFNKPQTAGPREAAGKPWKSVTYQWYAGKVETGADGKLQGTPVEFGAINLFPSDPLEQHPHGMVGALVVEPAESRWEEDAGSRLSATVYPAGGAAFRELVLIFQEEIVPQVKGAQKSYAFSYGTEPLEWRYGDAQSGGSHLANLDISCALSDRLRLLGDSQVTDPVGEPQTPLLVASAGAPVRFRVLHAGADEGGLMAMFTIDGHRWQDEPFTADSAVLGWNPTSESAGIRTANGPTDRFDVLLPSAGGASAVPGDYLYRSFTSDGLAGGLWGLLRVAEKGKDAVVVTDSTDKLVQGVISVFPDPTATGPVKTGQYAATVTVYKGAPGPGGDCTGAPLGPAVPVGAGGKWTFSAAGLSAKDRVCAKSAGGGVGVWLPYSEISAACGQQIKPAFKLSISPRLLKQLQIGRRKAGLKQTPQ